LTIQQTIYKSFVNKEAFEIVSIISLKHFPLERCLAAIYQFSNNPVVLWLKGDYRGSPIDKWATCRSQKRKKNRQKQMAR